MKLDRFLEERSPEWAELDAMLQRSGPTAAKLSASDVRRLGQLYRSAASDLAVARRYFPGSGGTLRLQNLVARAYGVVYTKVNRTDTVRTFFSRTLWQRIHESLRWIAVAGVVMALGVIFGAVWALHDPRTAATLLPGASVSAHSRGAFYGISLSARGGLAIQIFTNNILVSCLTALGGITFGALTAYMLAFNGALLGILGALEWRVGGFSTFLRLVVPHGMLELSCIALAGGAGFAIARALIDPRRLTRAEALGELTPTVGACTLGFMSFLVVAGLTEGFITPYELPTAAALVVGTSLAGGFWAMVVVRGRPSSP